MATIAALGTGVMGAPMARNLARAGHEVRAWNRSPEKAAALRDDGVDVRDDPAAAAAGADVVLTMLADADAVLDVARGANLADGQIWWQASTIGLDGTELCAALAQ
jgi:3-hydroxyisobutyrate dehydrogenase